MEIIIIVSAIGFLFAYIWLTPKTPGEIAQKKNPGFKSSLRHNPDRQNPEKVFRVLKEANLTPCFLDSELKKQQEISTPLFGCDDINIIYEDRGKLFNPQCKDGKTTLEVIQDGMEKIPGLQSNSERSALKVVKDGMKKIDKIEIKAQKDIIDSIESELIEKISPNLNNDSNDRNLLSTEKKDKKLVRKLTPNEPNKR